MPSATHSSRPRASAWPLGLALAISLLAHLLLLASGSLNPPPPSDTRAETVPPPLRILLGPPPSRAPTVATLPPAGHVQVPAHKRQAVKAAATRPLKNTRPTRLSAPRDTSPRQPATAQRQAPGRTPSLQDLLSQATAPSVAQASTDTAPPGRLVYGSSARGYQWQQYMDDWVRKMERIGAMNFPLEVRRQGLTGGPTLSVVINADGSLANLRIARSSGNPTLDSAAENLVRAAAPFAPFPPTLASQARSLEIRRKWSFSTENDLSVH